MSGEEDALFEFDLWDELAGLIARRMASHERTLQVEIGPSGFGTPCARKLGYRLAEIPAVNGTAVPGDAAATIAGAAWRPYVGQAVHKELAAMLDALNATELGSLLHVPNGRCKAPWCNAAARKAAGVEHIARYAVEFETDVGTIGGAMKQGHVDVFDRLKHCVIDWKIVGPKSLKDKRAACGRVDDPHPGDEYRVQGHIYARGLARSKGWDVKRIAIVFLPMNGELKDGFAWSEPYRPDIAAEAFRRARAIHSSMVGENGALDPHKVDSLLGRLKTAPDWCHRCDWFVAGKQGGASTEGCPGDRSMFADDQRGGNVEDLI